MRRKISARLREARRDARDGVISTSTVPSPLVPTALTALPSSPSPPPSSCLIVVNIVVSVSVFVDIVSVFVHKSFLYETTNYIKIQFFYITPQCSILL